MFCTLNQLISLASNTHAVIWNVPTWSDLLITLSVPSVPRFSRFANTRPGCKDLDMFVHLRRADSRINDVVGDRGRRLRLRCWFLFSRPLACAAKPSSPWVVQVAVGDPDQQAQTHLACKSTAISNLLATTRIHVRYRRAAYTII